MQKKLLSLLIFIVHFSILAQDREATLHFRDGTTILGYGDIIKEKNPGAFEQRILIIFKLAAEEKGEEWDGELVDRIVFHGFESELTFQFVPAPENKRSKYKLLRLIAEGEVSLHADIDDYFSTKKYTSYTTTPLRMSYDFSNGQPSPGRVSGGELQPVSAFPGQYQDLGSKYYLRRKGEDAFFNFTGSRKKIAAYFNNCPGVAKMLDAENFDSNTLEDIVNYYNDLCGAEVEDSETHTHED